MPRFPCLFNFKIPHCTRGNEDEPGVGESDLTLLDLGEVAGVCVLEDDVNKTDGGVNIDIGEEEEQGR